jgi:hypothetical protein
MFASNRKLGLCAVAVLLGQALLAAPKLEHAQEQRYVEHLKFLAAPEMEGRGAGTAGLQRAGEYVVDHFRRMGLQPIGDKGSYKQAFPVTTGAKLGAGNRLAVAGAPSALKLGEDYRPISFSTAGRITAGVVFAGYGITAPELNHDDYANLDAKGKLVLVLRYEPKAFTKTEPGKRPVYSIHSHLINKAINARNHGAAGVLLVNTEGGKDELIEFGRIAGPANARILMAQVKRSIAEEWLKTAGASLVDAKAMALPGRLRLSLHVDIERPQATVHNVLGYLPGKSKEYVVIGAHYDHIGYGHFGSLAPDKAGQVHPGADDNASGTAGLLELARMFSERRSELDRGILFAAFAGEEMGLLGSAKWVDQPTLPLKNAVAMINLDMIGRVNGAKLYVGGMASGSTFENIVKSVLARYNFKVEYSFKNSSSSDHASFIAKDVPSLFFFSGVHSDYHRPTDTWNKVDATASSEVVTAVADIVAGLMADARPQFVRAKPAPGRPRGSGPYLGVVPDDAPVAHGLRLMEIAEGSPAATAGLQAGDLLVAINDRSVADMYDMAYALAGRKAGDVLSLKLLRGGKPLTTDVTLATRQ